MAECATLFRPTSYDPFGRRTAKSIVSTTGNGDATNYRNRIIPEDWKDTRFIYSGHQVLMEEDHQGNLLRRFVYGVGIDEPVVMMSRYPGEPGDTLTTYYHHFDARGSTRFLTKDDGQKQEDFDFGSFGETWIWSQLETTPYQFAGRRFDEETGLYYNRARYYDPELGRFLQPDPIGYGDGLNLYAYVGNDPVNFVDPYGLTGRSNSAFSLSGITRSVNNFLLDAIPGNRAFVNAISSVRNGNFGNAALWAGQSGLELAAATAGGKVLQSLNETRVVAQSFATKSSASRLADKVQGLASSQRPNTVAVIKHNNGAVTVGRNPHVSG